jgi:SAM-dependent MidA family methyltransferase
VKALADRISRLGSVRFDEYVATALYDADGGFFARLGAGGRGRAGRAGGDFITSPEVGPLFGAVLARYLDARWEELGRPDPFVVVEAGAGRGALAISVLAAPPLCAPALRYVLVERSAALRGAQGEHLALSHPFEVLGPQGDADEGIPSPVAGSGPLVCSLPDLPAEAVDGVVLANELLDNVPFRLFERSSPDAADGDEGWSEVRVTVDAGRFVELIVPADPDLAGRLDALAPDARPGARVPLQDGAAAWLRAALAVLRTGSVLLFDYASSTTASLAERPSDEWLRTYREHERGGSPLDDPGSQDVTVEVAVDQLAAVATPDEDRTQDEWLRRWGIQGMVEDGRRRWEERAGVGDLAALRARSRAVEAEALCDPTGLGAFRVLEWRVPAPH